MLSLLPSLALVLSLANAGPFIGIVGQSNGEGYAAPLPGATIPPGVTIIKNGVPLYAYEAYTTGIEAGLADCLVNTLGLTDILIDVRADQGVAMVGLQGTYMPALVADAAALDLVPDAVVLIHGENDSTSPILSSLYYSRLVADRQYSGGVGGTWTDTSLFGQAARAWGVDVQWYVPLIRDPDNNEDPLLLDPGNGGRPYWRKVLAAQTSACELGHPHCRAIRTETVPIQPGGLHYSPDGYDMLGRMVCGYGRIDGLW